jgi:hypothetical protein
LTRTVDADQDSEITPGAFTFVEEGTVGNDNGYVCTNVGAITVGTTPITFVQFSGAGQVIAGDGLTKTGNTLNAVGTANRISISADAIDISSSYVGQATITTLGTIATGTWQGTVVAGQYGGTGVNNSGKTITIGGNLSTIGAFTTALTATANTTLTLPVQSIVTKDGKAIVIKAQIKYKIKDLSIFAVKVYDAIDALSDMTCGIIFQTIKDKTWEEACNIDLNKKITVNARREAKQWGIHIDKITVTDFSQIRSLRLFNEDSNLL